MSTNQELHSPDDEIDELTDAHSRRTLLRRSLLGVTGVGLAAVLSACGGDDDDDDDNGEDAVETVESEGEDAVDEIEDEGGDAVDDVEDEVDDATD